MIHTTMMIQVTTTELATGMPPKTGNGECGFILHRFQQGLFEAFQLVHSLFHAQFTPARGGR